MFRQLASSILLLIGLSASARADSFLWGGSSGNFSDPASWSGVAPAAGGSPSDQLIFPSPASNPLYIPTVDVPWTLNSLNFVSPGGLSLAAAPGAGLMFDGPNPTITQTGDPGANGVTLNTPITTSSGLTFDGQNFTLTVPLVSTGGGALTLTNGATLVYQNNNAPTGFSQIVLNPSTQTSSLTWNVTVPDSSPINLSFGSAAIVSTSGEFSVSLSTQPQATISATLSNPIVVQAYLRLDGTATMTIPADFYTSASFNFTGPVSLGGQLLLSSTTGDASSLNPVSTVVEVSGTITLKQSNPAELDLATFGGSQNQNTIISGNIVDDPDPTHNAHNPLGLMNLLFDSPSEFIIAGTHNTYSTGTIIEDGSVTVAPGSTLGTGPITVQAGILFLTSPSNLNRGQTVLLQYSQFSALSLNFDADPSAYLHPASAGTLDLDTTFATPLDMSKLGDGQMYLGSTANGIYTADTLRPAADHVYRITGSLVIAKSVLADYDGIPSSVILGGGTLAAPNSYSGGTTVSGNATAAAPGALGTGDVTIGEAPGFAGSAQLFLAAPNAYSPTAKVDNFGTLSAVGPNGSIPLSNMPPILHPGSALVLGDSISNNSDRYPDSMPLGLDGATLVLNGIGTTTEVVGPITVSDVATIVLGNPSTGANITTLITPSLTRIGHGVLMIVPLQFPVGDFFYGPLPLTPAAGNSANFQITAAPAVTNGMVAPWIQYRSTFFNNINGSAAPSFLTYGPAGFALATYIPMPSGPGSGTEVVDVSGNNGDVVITGDKYIYALRTSGNILSNGAVMPTIHIASGGLINHSNGAGYYDQTNQIQANVNFMNAEAVVNVQGPELDNDTQSLEITGVVAASQGITKIGTGALTLSNPANQIHGPLTILEGTLNLSALPDPTSTDPIRLYDGAALNFQNSTVLSRPVVINNGGNAFLGFSSIGVAPGKSLTIAAPISADVGVSIGNGAPYGDTLRIAAPIVTTGTVVLASTHIDLASNITAGGIDLAIGSQGSLIGAGVISCPDGILFDEGMLSPGEHAGDLAAMTFDTDTLGLSDGATFNIDLDAMGHSDRVLITGSLLIDDPVEPGSTTLALNFLAPPTGEIYTIVSASEIDGTFDTVTGLPAGYAVEYTPSSILIAPSSSSNEAAVPEPSVLGFFLAGGCTLLRLRRSRRTAAPKAY